MTYGNGRSPSTQLKVWHERKEVPKVRIVSLPPLLSCSVCRAADGTEYAIEDARSVQPLPHEGCGRPSPSGQCCCTYIPLFHD